MQIIQMLDEVARERVLRENEEAEAAEDLLRRRRRALNDPAEQVLSDAFEEDEKALRKQR